MQPVTVSAKHARYHCAKCPYVTLLSHNHGKGNRVSLNPSRLESGVIVSGVAGYGDNVGK